MRRLSFSLGFKTKEEYNDFLNTEIQDIRYMCFALAEEKANQRINLIEDIRLLMVYQNSKAGARQLSKHIEDIYSSFNIEIDISKAMSKKELESKIKSSNQKTLERVLGRKHAR